METPKHKEIVDSPFLRKQIDRVIARHEAAEASYHQTKELISNSYQILREHGTSSELNPGMHNGFAFGYSAELTGRWNLHFFNSDEHPQVLTISLQNSDAGIKQAEAIINTEYKTAVDSYGEELSLEDLRGWTEVTEQILNTES